MRVFIENQKFNQWWFHLIMVIPLLSIAIPLLLKNENIFSNKDLSNVWIPLVIIILVYSLILSVRLKTRIDEKGIYYQFFPFNLKLKLIQWNDLEQCYYRTYKPIKEFGGWGYRTKFGNGKAINIRGNMGIQLVFKNGKKLLIGTQKPNEINTVLETYNNKLSITKLDNSI